MSSEALPTAINLSPQHQEGSPWDVTPDEIKRRGVNSELGIAPIVVGGLKFIGGKMVKAHRKNAAKAAASRNGNQACNQDPTGHESEPGRKGKAARRIGASIAGLTLLGLPALGYTSGAGRATPAVMGGNIAVEHQEVETLSVEGMEDICLQKERKQYDGVVTMKGRWLNTDLSGFGVVNLNADKKVTVTNWQKDVIRCFPMNDILSYQYDPNNKYLRSGGTADKPTITVNVPLENMKTYIADAPDAPELPGTFTVETEGLTGWVLDQLAAQLKNKVVRDMLSPEIAQMADVGTQMDEIVKSVARVAGARAIGEACIRGLDEKTNAPEGSESVNTSSILENYLEQNIQKVIVNDFSLKKKDLPRLDGADVKVNFVNKLAYEKNATTNDEKDKKNAEALNKIIEEINKGGVFKFEPPTAATTAPVECKFSPAVVDGATPSSTPTDKGER